MHKQRDYEVRNKIGLHNKALDTHKANVKIQTQVSGWGGRERKLFQASGTKLNLNGTPCYEITPVDARWPAEYKVSGFDSGPRKLAVLGIYLSIARTSRSP